MREEARGARRSRDGKSGECDRGRNIYIAKKAVDDHVGGEIRGMLGRQGEEVTGFAGGEIIEDCEVRL